MYRFMIQNIKFVIYCFRFRVNVYNDVFFLLAIFDTLENHPKLSSSIDKN